VLACEIGYLRMADDLLEIADDASKDRVERQDKDGNTYTAVDHDHIARARIRVDTRKWLLSKALPKIFGDKLVNEHSGTIQTAFTDEATRKAHQAHAEMLGKRFGAAADAIEKVDHMAGLNARFGNKPKGKLNGSTPASADEDALNKASAQWVDEP
jgi:hypothetical protein